MSNFKIKDNNVTAILEQYLMLDGDLSKEEEKALAEKISTHCGVDLNVWEIDNHRITANIWTVNGKFSKPKGEGQEWKQATNKQLKIIISYKRIAPDNRLEFKKDLISTLEKKSPKVKLIKRSINGSLLLLDIPDLHLSRLSYGKETGDNYDIKIAEKRFATAMSEFREEINFEITRRSVEKILFIVGNDFFNYNHAKPFPQTSNGTPQESDVRFQKMFNVGSNLVIKQIELASEIAPVEILIIPGNHDEEIVFYLGEVINAWFRNNENITVVISPTMRKYSQFGKNMFGFSHGKYERFDRLFANMAFEEMKMWSNTTHKYFYTGHLHHKETKLVLADREIVLVKYPKPQTLVTEDFNGIMFDRLASLSSNDYYESSRGYVHIKLAEAFLFDKKLGKVKTFVQQSPLSIHSK